MRRWAWEWRKLFCLPALWVFWGLSLLCNGLLILSVSGPDRDFLNGTSRDAALLGHRVDSVFLEQLDALPSTQNRTLLLDSARGMENIFQDYDTGRLREFYQDVVGASPTASAWMGRKYSLLADRTAHLAQTGAAMDLYAGPLTQKSHSFLFGTLLRAILAQAALASMLGALHLLGYEELHGTQGFVCACRAGRRLYRTKVLAALAASPLFFALIALPSLGLYFALFDYSGIWGASVSSQFNFLTDLMLTRPFLTWADFTVAEYLAAFLALGAALTAAFALLAALCGLLVRSPYLAAMVLALLCLGGLGLTAALGEAKCWVGYLLFCFQPAIVWLYCQGWFTELGLNGVLPFQETAAVAADLLLLGLGVRWALGKFTRKDVSS